jgi:hypothetical protein
MLFIAHHCLIEKTLKRLEFEVRRTNQSKMVNLQWVYEKERKDIKFAFEDRDLTKDKALPVQVPEPGTANLLELESADSEFPSSPASTPPRKPMKDFAIPEDRATWEAYIAGEVDHPPEEVNYIEHDDAAEDDLTKKILGATACGLTCISILPLSVLL